MVPALKKSKSDGRTQNKYLTSTYTTTHTGTWQVFKISAGGPQLMNNIDGLQTIVAVWEMWTKFLFNTH